MYMEEANMGSARAFPSAMKRHMAILCFFVYTLGQPLLQVTVFQPNW